MYWRTLLVALLAVTAGCSAFSVADRQTPTVTPVPVVEATERTATPTGTSPLPPGVDASGAIDRDRLARAHVAASNGSTYRWLARHNGRAVRPNSTERTVIQYHARVLNETRYAYRTSRHESSNGSRLTETASTAEYANAQVRYERIDFDDPVHIQHRQQNASERIGRKMATAISEYLAVENATVAVTLVDGRRHYEITASEYAPETDWTVEEYAVRAIVSPDGLVRRIDANYTISNGDIRHEVDYHFEYEPVESLTVERPSWVTEEWGPPRRLDGDNRSSTNDGR